MENMGINTRKYLDNFKNKKVLVTGHTGFKGSWLSIWLKSLGADVLGYALDPYTKRDNFVVTDLKNKITDVRGDIRNYRKLLEVFNTFKPEYVFHLAAQSIVKEGYQDPKYTYDVNIGGTVNVLECSRKIDSVKSVINITSDKCYHNNEWIWGYRENDRMGGFDPYSSSKGCSELITNSFRNSFFNNIDKGIVSVRAGNVIGGGDWARHRIIPDCIKSIESNRSIKIRNPQAVRPWQFVLEPLFGYLIIALKLRDDIDKFSGAWNFGPNKSSIITVEKLASLLVDTYGKGNLKLSKNKTQEHEAKLLALDSSKAYFKLGWNPAYSIHETIENTVEWYKEYKNNDNMYDLCVNQIRKYMEEINL